MTFSMGELMSKLNPFGPHDTDDLAMHASGSHNKGQVCDPTAWVSYVMFLVLTPL